MMCCFVWLQGSCEFKYLYVSVQEKQIFDSLGSGTQELGSMIPMGLFQLRICYDSLWSEMDLFKLYILMQI